MAVTPMVGPAEGRTQLSRDSAAVRLRLRQSARYPLQLLGQTGARPVPSRLPVVDQ